jgi:hypothetical protein
VLTEAEIEREVGAFLEGLADLYFTQQDRHPEKAKVTYRHSLKALYETDSLRVALGGRSCLRPDPSVGFFPSRA